LNASSGPRRMAGAGATTSTAGRSRPPTHSPFECPRRLWVMSHLSTVALGVLPPRTSFLPGLWLLTHQHPSHPVPDGVGWSREQFVSIQGSG
jgi:hypothetical protein